MSVCHLLQTPMMKTLLWHTIQYLTAMVLVNLTYPLVPNVRQEVTLVQMMIINWLKGP
uniref:Uncharacterized protein n=1 Tax=Arundo donax TaxID=35708 RepID=A0A0A9ESC3_ARUDO